MIILEVELVLYKLDQHFSWVEFALHKHCPNEVICVNWLRTRKYRNKKQNKVEKRMIYSEF